MGFFKVAKSKEYSALILPDKDTSSQVSEYSTKTTGPAIARSFKGGSATYAEAGGRAAASSRHGSAWSNSVAYGGDSKDEKRNPHQVSLKGNFAYTSGNAIAAVTKGGTLAYAGPGGYANATYHDGSRFSTSVAYGGEKKERAVQFRYSDSDSQRIEPYYPSSGEEDGDSD